MTSLINKPFYLIALPVILPLPPRGGRNGDKYPTLKHSEDESLEEFGTPEFKVFVAP